MTFIYPKYKNTVQGSYPCSNELSFYEELLSVMNLNLIKYQNQLED